MKDDHFLIIFFRIAEISLSPHYYNIVYSHHDTYFNPCPHKTNMQQTTWRKFMENYLMHNIENIVAKGEKDHYEQLILSQQYFKSHLHVGIG